MTRPPFGRPVPGNRWDLLAGEHPDPAPLVSVVVVHYEQQAELDRTLAALGRQTHGALEVIVADDGSPTPPRVPDGVRVVAHEDRGYRPAATRNLGARAATGDVLCFLDADTAPEPHYVERLSRLPALAPETVTVGLRRYAAFGDAPPDAPVEVAGPAHELPGPRWLADGYVRTADLLRADDRAYRFVISAVLACSRWFFETVGPFDETFESYGGEDWDWAARAWLDGAVLAHVPDAVAWHDGPDWEGRDGTAQERQAVKNDETLRLADSVAIPGSRGLALRGRHPDVVVRLDLPAGTPAAAAFLCADTVLADLPEADVVLPVAFAGGFRDRRVVTEASEARVHVTLTAPLRVAPGALRAAVDRVGPEGLGTLRLGAHVTITTQRRRARAARWGEDLLSAADAAPDGLEPIDGEPDLEAHLGGWG